MSAPDLRSVRMFRDRLGRQRDLVIAELHRSLVDDHSPENVARSFSVGAFITMLPTLGTGLGLFVVMIYLFNWVNKIALFASVLVFNPIVKWGVYAASFSLGVFLLGPIEGISTTDVSLSAGGPILLRLIVGNLILAVFAAVLAYIASYRIATAYEGSNVGEVIGEAIEELADTPETN